MHRIIILVLIVVSGCHQPRTLPEQASQKRNVFPNVRVTINTENGNENINVKHAHQSFFNYAQGTPKKHTAVVLVPDATYLKMRDLCIDILRNPPTNIDKENIVNISLSLLDEELPQNGLQTNNCTFSHQPGTSETIDKLMLLTTQLLDKHREKQQ